jgi:upstream activation factor subunit UAF30
MLGEAEVTEILAANGSSRDYRAGCGAPPETNRAAAEGKFRMNPMQKNGARVIDNARQLTHPHVARTRTEWYTVCEDLDHRPDSREGSIQDMATKKKAIKKAAKKTAVKRKPNAAFMKPMTVSAALGAVIGNNAMPRTEVTKKIWAYIKRNKLQDSKNRRNINADDKLKEVFGGKKTVSMFEMTKLVAGHLK